MSRVAEIWLSIAAGGRWSAEEVHEDFPEVSMASVNNAIWQVVEGGTLRRFEDGRYGVTQECKVPRGMTIADVMKAIA